jgi:hypothetical protein
MADQAKGSSNSFSLHFVTVLFMWGIQPGSICPCQGHGYQGEFVIGCKNQS